MKNPDGKVVLASLGKEISVVSAQAGVVTPNFRVSFFGDAPDGIVGSTWFAMPPDSMEFIGEYEHIKAIKPKADGVFWARVFDENGFWYDTPTVILAIYNPVEAE